MSVDIHATAGCGCFVTSLGPAGVAVAMCKTHTGRAREIFDREPAAIDGLLAAVYDDGALARVTAVLDEWDRVCKGPSPTTTRLRDAIAGEAEEVAS